MDDPNELLPQVRIGTCGCILPGDAKPVGYVFKATQFGDVRQPVFACPGHTHLGPLSTPAQPATKVAQHQNKRSRAPQAVPDPPAGS